MTRRKREGRTRDFSFPPAGYGPPAEPVTRSRGERFSSDTRGGGWWWKGGGGLRVAGAVDKISEATKAGWKEVLGAGGERGRFLASWRVRRGVGGLAIFFFF